MVAALLGIDEERVQVPSTQLVMIAMLYVRSLAVNIHKASPFFVLEHPALFAVQACSHLLSL